MNYKSFDDIRPTAAMLADDVGRKIMQGVATGRHNSVADIERAARCCGRGEALVKHTTHFRVAHSLLKRDG